MAPTAVVHDHFVLLMDTATFENPPAWLSKNFKIIEGGTHAGGSSRNKLIIFKDGTYLELFNWIKEPVEFLDWAYKKPGLIDFAITTLSPVTPEQNFDTVTENLSQIPKDADLGVNYVHPQAGGRKRADGQEVKWKNSRPSFKTTEGTPDVTFFPDNRIDVPFFCHDVTDRTVRVPFDEEGFTSHPCGAVGIDSVEVFVPETHFNQYVALYSAVLDVGKPEQTTDKFGYRCAYFKVGVPHPLDSVPAYVVVRAAPLPQESNDSDDTSALRVEDRMFLKDQGIGIRSLTLRKTECDEDDIVTDLFASHRTGSTVKVRG